MLISSLLPLFVSGTGLFLLFRLKFFFFIHPIKTALAFFSELKSPESRKSLCLALAGTLGVGNIFGTASGIMLGGAGSVFWLLLSSVFSAVLKFSEASLALELKEEKKLGFGPVLPKIFKKHGSILALIYSALCLLLAFFMGAAVQSSAATDICSFSMGIPNIITATLLCLFIFLGILGGAGKIEKITAVLVPIASLAFVFLAFSSLLVNRNNIPNALNLIFTEAFDFQALSGGIFGFLSSKAVTEGFARGILSNEAGIGTSAVAHSISDNRPSFVGGLFGIAEVLSDTVIICGITALALLSSPLNYKEFVTPMSYVGSVFYSSLGKFSSPLLIISILIFAYSTMICWYYYGTECVKSLFGKSHSSYIFAFLASVVFGALAGAKSLLLLTDAVIFLMALITLSALIYSHRKIEKLTTDYFKKH